MKILFLHGLEGGASNDQQHALLAHGEIISPQIYYGKTENVYQDLNFIAQQRECDVIIGLGVGGLLAFYLSCTINVPCLIFDPTLPNSTYRIAIPERRSKRNQYLQVALLKNDLLANANDRLLFLENNTHDQFSYSIHLLDEQDAHLNVSEFQNELRTFFNVVNFKQPIQGF